MRCEIAASLLHNPKILFLDEPTIGLDAVSKIAVRDFIRHLNRERKTTVILTTHDMQDIEALDRTHPAHRPRADPARRHAGRVEKPERAGTPHERSVCGGYFDPPEGVVLTSDENGHAAFTVDTRVCGVSRAIEQLSRHAEITDLSVAGTTAEELVVSLYEEFAI